MSFAEQDELHAGGKTARLLDRAEALYLRVLRAATLLIATLLVVFAAGLAIYSLYKVFQSPESVQEETASVTPEDLATGVVAPDQARPASGGGAPNASQRRFYEQFAGQYFTLYRERFERFRRSEDRPLSAEQFSDRFVGVDDRIDAVAAGRVNFEEDRRDLQALLATMRDAADLPETTARLERYRSAQRSRSCRPVERQRTEYVTRWNPYGTSCPYWYESGGCAERRPVQRTVTVQQCDMALPADARSPAQLFRGYQDRYFQLLGERRVANAARAQSERERIIQGNADGSTGLYTALTIAGGFLALMFFFLLIAIERHQRRLATVLASERMPPPDPSLLQS